MGTSLQVLTIDDGIELWLNDEFVSHIMGAISDQNFSEQQMTKDFMKSRK